MQFHFIFRPWFNWTKVLLDYQGRKHWWYFWLFWVMVSFSKGERQGDWFVSRFSGKDEEHLGIFKKRNTNNKVASFCFVRSTPQIKQHETIVNKWNCNDVVFYLMCWITLTWVDIWFPTKNSHDFQHAHFRLFENYEIIHFSTKIDFLCLKRAFIASLSRTALFI